MTNCKRHLMMKGDFFFLLLSDFSNKNSVLISGEFFGHFPSTRPIYFSVSCEQFLNFSPYKPWCQIHILLEVSESISPQFLIIALCVIVKWQHNVANKIGFGLES